MKAYLVHRRRSRRPTEIHHYTLDWLSHLSVPLRAIVKQTELESFANLTPMVWFAYVDTRLAAGIKPVTLNSELTALKEFMRFYAEQGQPVCTRMLDAEPLKTETHLPRDLAVEKVQLLLKEINADSASQNTGVRRMGLMDKAWFLLMLHSGLRSAEVRRMTLEMLDFVGKKVRIEQSKGLKDRMVYLSTATIQAMEQYFQVRGPAATEMKYT